MKLHLRYIGIVFLVLEPGYNIKEYTCLPDK